MAPNDVVIDTSDFASKLKAAAPVVSAEDMEFKPTFEALSAQKMNGNKVELRRVPVPQHRFTPLKENWMAIYKPSRIC